MKRIRTRPRLDVLRNQERASPARWGRRIYLALLGGLGLAVANHFVGDMVLLRADGIVVADRHVVAATFPARITAVRVKEGDAVRPGDVLVEAESPDMLKQIAELATRNGELSIREAQLRTRLQTTAELLPFAERHARESGQHVAGLNGASARGLVSNARIDQVLNSGYETSARLADLRGQTSSLAAELSLVEGARRRSEEALAKLQDFYADGIVKAPAGGVVGARVPSPGQVVRFADELLQVHQPKTYVLAYLPDSYLFGLAAGDRIEVASGTTRRSADVEALLPVSDALPPEFQNMFRPRDRSRLVRIPLPDGAGFAIGQKVRLTRCWTPLCT